jgi:hypothetical protein
MAAGTGADGASGMGNDEMDISKGGEKNQWCFGSTSRCTGAVREGEQARRGGGGRSMVALGFNTKEKGASGPVGPNGRMGRTKLGW